MAIDWYDHRNKLRPDMVFRLYDGDVVMLDRSVPGDATQWYAAVWSDYSKGWGYEDYTVEPGDLVEQLPDGWSGE
jgi:hypothetical protein